MSDEAPSPTPKTPDEMATEWVSHVVDLFETLGPVVFGPDRPASRKAFVQAGTHVAVVGISLLTRAVLALEKAADTNVRTLDHLVALDNRPLPDGYDTETNDKATRDTETRDGDDIYVVIAPVGEQAVFVEIENAAKQSLSPEQYGGRTMPVDGRGFAAIRIPLGRPLAPRYPDQPSPEPPRRDPPNLESPLPDSYGKD